MEPVGLTSADVAQRKSEGKSNDFEEGGSRSYLDILLKNLITPFNIVLFILGAALLYFHDPLSAIAATGIIIFNVLISTIQEMRAKRRLDKIALLMRPKVKALRDGKVSEIDRSEIVMDDVIYMTAGDQAQVDGEILCERSLEMDESLLTGESSTRRKHEGDEVLSGSYVVTGECWFVVTKVGEDTFSAKMLRSARKFEKKKTPLQVETNAVTELLMVIAFFFLALMVVLNLFIRDIEVDESLRQAVIVLDIVPIALFLLITLTYMVAAVRMADSGVLLQSSNSVESMSHVDTVCMDKTGTITTNNLVFEGIEYLVDDGEETDRLIREFVGTTGSRNRTVIALENKYGKGEYELDDEVQFSSDRKYSAVRVRNGDTYDTIVMGAWSFLEGRTENPDGIDENISQLASKGLRTVVFCTAGSEPLHDADGNVLEPKLRAIAIISIMDEIRPDCRDILQGFREAGVDIKVISGDDPETVDAIFSLAHIPGKRKIVSGEELDKMDDAAFTKAALETNIFGRMRPEQKEKVIETLRREGRYVAMVGDGINDVRSIKKAQVGVAVQSGSGAARGVADMVLINDDFKALPRAVVEGKRTVSGMRDILRLYLARNFTLAFLVLILLLVLNRTPMMPIQNTAYALLTVSVVAFFMTFWAKPSDNKDLILPRVMRYVLPASLLMTAFGLVVYFVFYYATLDGVMDLTGLYKELADGAGWSLTYAPDGSIAGGEFIDKFTTLSDDAPIDGKMAEINARNGMLLFLFTSGISQLFLLFPPSKKLSARLGQQVQYRPALLGVLMILLLAALYSIPEVSVVYVKLLLFRGEQWAFVLALTAAWFAVTAYFFYSRLTDGISVKLERFIRRLLARDFEKNDRREQEDFEEIGPRDQ